MGAIAGETPLPPLGPLALPGKYEVRLTAGGQTYRQPLEVKMDPRVRYIRNDLRSSLALQMRISDTLGHNFTAYQQVKDLRSRLAEFKKRPAQDTVAVAATQLDAKAAAIQGESVTAFDTPKNSLITVNDSLVGLIALVDGADFTPSDESFAALRRVCLSMNTTLDDWQQLKIKDVAAFNHMLDEQKLAAVPTYPEVATPKDCAEK